MAKDIQHKKGIIRVEKKEYKGYEFIDVRKYYESEDGKWLPTKKGIALSPDIAEEVAQAILDSLT